MTIFAQISDFGGSMITFDPNFDKIDDIYPIFTQYCRILDVFGRFLVIFGPFWTKNGPKWTKFDQISSKMGHK